jgi:hypothetical protein
MRISAYFDRRRDKDRSEHWLNHFELSVHRRRDAVGAFWTTVSRNEATPTSLSSDVVRVMKEALDRDKRIADAWLMEHTVPLATAESPTAAQLVVHGLVLKIDTHELNRGATQEDQIAEHYEWALSTLVPPEQHVCVTTYLTTEPERTFDERFRLA